MKSLRRQAEDSYAPKADKPGVLKGEGRTRIPAVDSLRNLCCSSVSDLLIVLDRWGVKEEKPTATYIWMMQVRTILSLLLLQLLLLLALLPVLLLLLLLLLVLC